MVTDVRLKWVCTFHTGDTVDGGPYCSLFRNLLLFAGGTVYGTRYCSYRVAGTVYESCTVLTG
jgi:hypothetical protein